MTAEMWIALIALAGSVAGGAMTFRQSKATTAVEASKVDAAAYDRAKAIYEGALNTLEEQLAGVRTQLNSVTAQLNQEQDTSANMRTQIRDLRAQIAQLERTVADLRLQLAKSGIPVEEEST